MNAQSTAIAPRREAAPIEVLKHHLASKVDEFKMVLPQHITPEKFQRVIATAALQNPTLLTCDRQSLLLSAMKLAQDGLLPDGREAALVPFKTRVKGDDGQFRDKWLVQPMPMVYGLRKKILQSGEVLSIETGVVYLADYQSGRFLYEVGLEPPIRYRPDLLLPIEETTDDKIVAAYSMAKIKNETGGDPYFSVEVMRRAEIDKVRQASQTGAVGRKVQFGKDKGKPIEPKGPWVDWFSEMARKTVLRRHAKVLPMSGDILETFERDIEAEREADRTAAESAAGFLSVEEREPVVLPGNDELAAGGGEVIDQATGEVVTNAATGMTEVGEDVARQLDAQDTEDRASAVAWVESLERAFADAKTDAEKQAVHEGNAATISQLEAAYPDLHERAMAAIPAYDEVATLDPHRGQPWAEKRRELLDKFNTAETPADLTAANKELERHYVSFPDEIQGELNAAFTENRKRVRGEG